MHRFIGVPSLLRQSISRPSHSLQPSLLGRRLVHVQTTARQASQDGRPGGEAPRELLARRMMRSFGLMIVTGSVAFAVYTHLKAKADSHTITAVKSVGAPKIGGPFTLFDTNGQLVTEADYPGYRLLYFGFTFCPDICPTELTKMGDALRIVEAGNARLKEAIHPIFVSVDPWRDSVAQVRAYVAEFHPRMVGLTGTPLEIEKVCKRYRIYYSKPPKKVRDGIVEDEFYLMDHSAYMYLFNPAGECIDYFPQSEPAEEIARRLVQHTKQEGPWWSALLK